ncbi:MAG: hypothetical protein AAB377_02045 [Patescibacteria group bacterium]
MSKLQSAILGALAGLLVIEGFVFWDKNKNPVISMGEVVQTPAQVFPIEMMRISKTFVRR